MANYIWLLIVAGGAFLLGGALAFGVMRQRPLSGRERDLQNQRTRELYGTTGGAGDADQRDGADQVKARYWPLLAVVIFIVIGCALGYHVATMDTAPSVSVEGKEEPGSQPAGPADKNALPGSQ
ncbi:hypothetical protein [Rhizobium sp. Root1204]|uniref:hypothetical protein n=1 Tax=Rhizobium sp. Root1204 TaxID=1736428 RepID=UPI0007148F0B|nr:hypothetical protein [Rhizobium sp. Root1204]KQV33274.1 hypothetical protein ASC96_30515 [Rhizobium sp. Root1204]